jgi:N-acetylglucosaminyldiphosphoundecaprenol N-acetyl-beta-D-mannosaminyltransferase
VSAVTETRRRVSLLGCEIDALTFAETLAEVDRLVRRGEPSQHCVVNASKLVLMDGDARLRGIVASCALVNADGQSVVWASRLLGRPLPERVTGIDLFRALLAAGDKTHYRVYFLGARPDVVGAVAARAAAEHPGLVVCGWRDGYWGDADDVVVAAIRAAAPDILFVGMPSPRKEYWLSEHLGELAVPFCMGVGGSFDVYAGRARRAPRWMQRAGLEWAYRFLQEPTRMWRRYLLGNAAFMRMVAVSAVRERRAWAAARGGWRPGGRGGG